MTIEERGIIMDNSYLKQDQLISYQLSIQQRIDTHQHRNVELIFLLKGSLKIRIEEEEFNLEEQDIIIVNSTFKHKISAEHHVTYVIFHLNYYKILELLHASKVFFLCNSSIGKKEDYVQVRKYLTNILKVHYENQVPNQINLNSLYYQLLDHFISHFSVTYNKGTVDGAYRGVERRNEIENYIEANYFKSISLKDLAEFLFLTPPYVSKYFKEQFGMNFNKYLNQVRLFHAVNELLGTNHSITSIAMNNGFPNVNSFNKLFKEEYSNTPHDYRINSTQEQRKDILELPSYWRENLKDIFELPADREQSMVSNQLSILEVHGNDKTPFFRYWTKVINLNEAAMLSNFSPQEQITKLKQDLGFEYGRIWNVFSKDMKLLTPSKSTKLNFFNLERVFDFLMDHQIKPYIVLNPLEDFHQLSIIDDSDSEAITKFIDIFKSFISHVNNRYGKTQVKEWYFEVVFNVENKKCNESFFFQLFNSIKEVLYSFSVEFKVGGPGLPIHLSTGSSKEFLTKWFVNPYQPDFITIHSDLQPGSGMEGERELRKIMDAQYIQNQVLMVKRIIKDIGYDLHDIELSNWDFNMSHHNMLNDSCYKAAYLIKNIIDSYGLLQAMGYWYALDSLSELADTPNLLYGGSGLLSTQGLKKPSYYVVILVIPLSSRQMKKAMLPARTDIQSVRAV
ncbi:GH39 family glycosyl hydrolase [Paenibacillus amylolyticus]|nr:helix-turn-helix domain-containing protein [Paenibacillus amylolyticus]